MDGDVRRHINHELDHVPQPLAENLDTHLASAALRKYETRRNPNGMLRSAWNFAEYALNADDMSNTEREEHFRTSQLLTSMVMAHPKVHQDTILSALTLSTYIPLFGKRGADKEIGNQECEDVYRSLGMAMHYLRPLTVDEPPQWRMTEMSILALSARSRQPQFLMYPASPREEASNVSAFNHDSYFFDRRGKIPVQQKLLPTQKVYDECIKVLTVQPMIDKALKKSRRPADALLSDKVNYLLSLIITEISGEKLTKNEVVFLNEMTEAVVAHYVDLGGSNNEKSAA